MQKGGIQPFAGLGQSQVDKYGSCCHTPLLNTGKYCKSVLSACEDIASKLYIG